MSNTDKPKLPILCDHEGCQAAAVGKYVIGGGKGFEVVDRCREHAGNAEMKEAVNGEGK